MGRCGLHAEMSPLAIASGVKALERHGSISNRHELAWEHLVCGKNESPRFWC